MKGLTRDRGISVALVAPSIVLIAVFVYGFIGFTGFSSLTKWDSLQPDFTFVGLHNYARLFSTVPTDRFLCDLRNTVTFTVLFLVACIVIGFFLAVLLDRHVKGEGIFRNIFLFPMAISYIVTGVVWRWILSPGNAQTGATGLNQLFDKVGLGFLKWGWFTDPTILYIHPESGFGTFLGHIGLGGLASPYIGVSLAMISVVFAATWQMSGYTMAMYLAALRGIPTEMREAARVDGATEFQIYRRVIVPMIRPVTWSALIVLGHISLKIFDLVVSMTGPGPAFATDVPALYMWDTTFRGGNFAQGAAIATLLLLVVALLIIPYLVSTNRKEARPMTPEAVRRPLRVGPVVVYALLVIASVVYLTPVLVQLITGLKSFQEVSMSNMWKLPTHFSLESYARAWSGAYQGLNGLSVNFMNSVYLTVPATLISAFLGSMNGYVLAKWKFRGANILFPMLLFGMFIPYQSILIPLVRVLQNMHLYSTRAGLIFVHIVYGIPITTLIFRNYYAAIPDELIEAAKIDGAGILGIYGSILFPLSLPGFVVVMIWQFTSIWNDFLFAVIITSKPSLQPITVALNNLAGSFSVEWNVQMAGALIAALPTLLVYIFLSRYFMSGLLAGSVKG